MDWYKLERGEVTPPFAFQFDSDTDTRYFSEKLTSFPVAKLHELYENEEGHPLRDFTFYGDEFSHLHQEINRDHE